MDDPWGVNEPPAPHPYPPEPLPPQLAKLAALTAPHVVADGENWDNPGPEVLPEVAALLIQGWRLLDGDPRHVMLPAIWPRELRCWLPDRLPQVSMSFDGQQSIVFPSDQPLHPRPRRMMDFDYKTELAAEVGLPKAPPGRIWLLKSPCPWLGLKMVLRLFVHRAAEQDEHEASAVFAAAREMLQWDESELRAWWRGEEADAALAWQEQGRVGEEVVELVCAGIDPDAFARLPGLTPEQAAQWRWAAAGDSLQDAVDRAVFFRSVGLPADPPGDLYRLADLSPDDIRDWLAAGFDVPTMVELTGITLNQAISWREHGYTSAQTQQLLQADPALTPAEADEFAAAGIIGQHRMEWIQEGFGAADAAGFDEDDVQPNEARVWRSKSLGSADVRPGQHLPPGYELGGWIISAGMRMRDVEHSVTDPPDTRGAAAARRREHLQLFRDR